MREDFNLGFCVVWSGRVFSATIYSVQHATQLLLLLMYMYMYILWISKTTTRLLLWVKYIVKRMMRGWLWALDNIVNFNGLLALGSFPNLSSISCHRHTTHHHTVPKKKRETVEKEDFEMFFQIRKETFTPYRSAIRIRVYIYSVVGTTYILSCLKVRLSVCLSICLFSKFCV